MLNYIDYGRHFKVINDYQKIPARCQSIIAKLLRLFCGICTHLHISAYWIVSSIFEEFLPGTEMTRLSILQMILTFESDNYNYLNDPFNLCQYHMTVSVDERVVADKKLLFTDEEVLPARILAEATQIWELECLTTEKLYVTIQDMKNGKQIKLLFDHKSYEDEILKSLDEEWADTMAEQGGEPPYAGNKVYACSEAI